MLVKVKIHKRVLLSFELEVEVRPGFDKDALIQAVHMYAPEEAEGWEQEGSAEYDADKTGVPRDSVAEVKSCAPYFDDDSGLIVEKP